MVASPIVNGGAKESWTLSYNFRTIVVPATSSMSMTFWGLPTSNSSRARLYAERFRRANASHCNSAVFFLFFTTDIEDIPCPMLLGGTSSIHGHLLCLDLS
jgi:hypothetical protein